MDNQAGQREVLVYLAKVHEQTEQYESMVDCMKKVAKMDVKMSAEERNLLSVAFKQHIGDKRCAWRTIKLIEEQTRENVSSFTDESIHKMAVERIVAQRESFEREIQDICTSLTNLIDEYLLKSVETSEEYGFLYKLKADYHRYCAELFRTAEPEEKIETESKEQAKEAYENAEKQLSKLPSTNTTRLGLYLNYSVFIHEILGDTDSAIRLAEKSFEDAMEELDELSRDEYQDCIVIMQLLRDNVKIWSTMDKEMDSDDENGLAIQDFD